MFQRVRTALMTACVLALCTASARADDCGAPCATPAPCAPAMQTVQVTEWVPENVLVERTVLKKVCVTENYTAYRTECVPEKQERTFCVQTMVPEQHDVVRTYCVAVPTTVQKTIMKPVWTCKPVTTVCRKCVDMGHYECQEVPCHESCLTKLRHRHKHDDCCEPCPPPTKTVKVWVPCKVWVETPVTTMVKTCDYVPTVVDVCVCNWEQKTEVVKVCSYRCVTEQKKEMVTVMVPKCVAYQAARTVVRCEPVVEKVTVCRMVAHVVEKQVPVETSCYMPCECGHQHKSKHRCR